MGVPKAAVLKESGSKGNSSSSYWSETRSGKDFRHSDCLFTGNTVVAA